MGINLMDFLLGVCVGAGAILLAWLYEIGKEIDRMTKEIEETIERLGLKKKT